MCRSIIPNKTTFIQYCLSRWISKLRGSFEINWVRQYLVNITGQAGIVNTTIYRTESSFNTALMQMELTLLHFDARHLQAILSRHGNSYILHWIAPLLVNVMAWHRIGGKNHCWLIVNSTNFSENLIKIQYFPFTKKRLKISSMCYTDLAVKRLF